MNLYKFSLNSQDLKNSCIPSSKVEELYCLQATMHQIILIKVKASSFRFRPDITEEL